MQYTRLELLPHGISHGHATRGTAMLDALSRFELWGYRKLHIGSRTRLFNARPGTIRSMRRCSSTQMPNSAVRDGPSTARVRLERLGHGEFASRYCRQHSGGKAASTIRRPWNSRRHASRVPLSPFASLTT